MMSTSLAPVFAEPDLGAVMALVAPRATLPVALPATPPAAPPASPPAVPPADGPVPILRGRISIYVLPDQSLVLVFRPDGETEDRRQVIPGYIVASAAAMGGGSVTDLLARVTETLS